MKSARGLCLLFVLLLGLPSTRLVAQCQNKARSLGGMTAIERREVVDELSELQAIMQDAKFQKALHGILAIKKTNLREEDYPKLVEAIGRLTQKDLRDYPRGTQLLWMASRKVNRQIRILSNVCWVSKKPFKAWTFYMEINGKTRQFILPAKCLNLGEIKHPQEPPMCEITASPDCDKSKAVVKVTAEAGTGSKITDVSLTVTHDGKEQPAEKLLGPPFQKDLEGPGTYILQATATADNGLTSPGCKATVAICPPKIEKGCKAAPSCQLGVKSEWNEPAGSWRLRSQAPARTARPARLRFVLSTSSGVLRQKPIRKVTRFGPPMFQREPTTSSL